jgi:hypothetical protein
MRASGSTVLSASAADAQNELLGLLEPRTAVRAGEVSEAPRADSSPFRAAGL